MPITTYPLEPSDALPEALAYHGEEPNSQERKQRRRPGGRKRKRRPHIQQPVEAQNNNNIETQTEWQSDKPEATAPDNQAVPNTKQDIIVSPTGGIFAHTDVQSQVVRVQGVNNAVGRTRGRESSIQATAVTERATTTTTTTTMAPTTTSTTTTRSANKSYRRPYSVAKKEEAAARDNENASSSAASAADLKNLLKQSGGLSLSEILQQQNLSLDDLLKGKQKAIKALQNTAVPTQPTTTEETITTTQKSPRRLPPSSRRPQSTATTPSIREITQEQLTARRNMVNRFANFQRQTQLPTNQPQSQPQQQTTQPAPVYETRESAEVPMVTYLLPAKKVASTIPTITVEANPLDTYGNGTGSRRLPVLRTKPIKEVVSDCIMICGNVLNVKLMIFIFRFQVFGQI